MMSAYRRIGNYGQFLLGGVLFLAGLVFLMAARPAGATDIWTDASGDNSWHTGAPNDWSTGTFTGGDSVQFDDSAPAGAYVVSIATGGVNPAIVTVNNSANDYSLVGPGFIGNAFGAALTKTGSGMLTIANSAANTYGGGTVVQGGLLQLDLTNLATHANLLSSSSGLVMQGGAFAVTSAATGASSQTVNGTVISAGDSSIRTGNTAAGAGNTTSLALGALSRSAGATVDFNNLGGPITTTTGNTPAGIIGGWATVNNDDWATASGAGPIFTIQALAAGSYTADAWASGNNTDVTGDSVQAQDSTTNSLRFNQNASSTVGLSSANGSTFNTIQSGGILVGSANVNTQAVPNYTIAGGNLTSGTSDLIVNQRGVGSLTISSTIVDRGANPISLTKSGFGLLVLSGANTYTAGTQVNSGTLAVQNTSGSGTGFGNVNVAGGATLAGGTFHTGVSQGIIGTPSNQVSVTIASGGTLSPSGPVASGGTITSGGPNNLVVNGNLTLSDNSNLAYVLSNSSTAAGPANGNDLLTVTGTVALGNAVSLSPNADFSYGSGNYTLINGYSTANNTGNLASWILNGYATAVPVGSPAPTFSQTAGSIVLNIPSPVVNNNPPPHLTPNNPNVDFPGFTGGGVPPQEPPASPSTPKPTQHFVGCNEDVKNLSGAAENTINIVLKGNWTGPGVLQNNYPTFGVGNTNFSTAFNATTNQTTLTISSKNGKTVPAGRVAHVGYSLLNGAGTTGEGGSAETAAKYWGAPRTNGNLPTNPNFRLPAPTFFIDNLSPGNPTFGPNTQFLILYSTIELGNQNVGGEWSELQVPNGSNIQVGIGNNDTAGDGPMFSFDTKFFLSDTQIPLDDLNNVYEPPTGSNFQPLPGLPDGTSIAAGSSAESSPILVPLPEPSAAVLLTAASGLAFLWRSRRKADKL
ncbi:MAG TPA: autotransporter-associated beta strand repeat-containing protein [Pirellulales bacterium]|jgi:autotransporter-associated beta strand protein|nr:autotransporter-associated beta strand repeat-containing protein [Pirellulales bacterium]